MNDILNDMESVELNLSEEKIMDFIRGYCKKPNMNPSIFNILVLLKTILLFVGKLSNELLLNKNFFSMSFFDTFSSYKYNALFGNMIIDTGKGYTLKQEKDALTYFPEYEWSLKIKHELINGVKLMIATRGESINEQLKPWVKTEQLLLNEQDEEYNDVFEDDQIYFCGINVGVDGIAMTNGMYSIMVPYQGMPFNQFVNDTVIDNEYTIHLRITNGRFNVTIVNDKDIVVNNMKWVIPDAKYRLMLWIPYDNDVVDLNFRQIQ